MRPFEVVQRVGDSVEQDGSIKSSGEAELDQTISASDAAKSEDGRFEGNDHSNDNSSAKKSNHQLTWRRIIRNFTPSWFAVNMGTGISSILLYNLPYNGHWLQYISYMVFALNVLLFGLFSFLSLLRYTLYPKLWVATIRDPAQVLFLGCFPVGFATIINMICFVCVPAWEGDWWKLAWAFWWIDAILATASCLYVPWVIMDTHTPNLSSVTAIWLIPVIANIVAAGAGAVVCGILPHANDRLITLITSYILWSMGVTLSTIITLIYFLRITTKGLVATEFTVSTFIPLGPCGMGGFAILELGTQARLLFHDTQTLPSTQIYAGDVLYIIGFFVALVLWSYGLVWLFFALASIWRTPKFPFNLGWWSLTFPLGVYAVSTNTLAQEVPSAFFRVLGTIFSITEVLLWIFVSGGTIYHVYTGELFPVPSLTDLDDERSGSDVRNGSPRGIETQKQQ